MKSRKRISRKLIIASGIFTVFISAYLHFGLLPGGLNETAVMKISRLTGKKVFFTKILYLPYEGFSLYNVKVLNKDGSFLFSAKKISVNARVIPFFRDKKIIISNLHLNSPVYEFLTHPDRFAAAKLPVKTQISGQIDVPVVSDQKKIGIETLREEGAEAFLPENVYLEQIEILNGLVTIRKNASEPVLEEINSINVRMGFQKPPKLSFDGSLKLGHKPYASISLKGAWDLKKADYEFYLDTKSDFIPSWLLEYQKKHFIVLEQGRVKLSTHLKSVNETLAIFHSQAALKDAKITAGSGVYLGEMGLDVQGAFDFETRRFDRYRGALDLKGVEVLGLTKTIDSLKNLNGRIRFQPDLLEFVNVEGRHKNVPFKTTGSLSSFRELNLDETIFVESSVEDALNLVPDSRKKLIRNFAVGGRCQAVTTVRGSLRQKDALILDYKLHVWDGWVENPSKKIRAEEVSADIAVGESGFQIKNARFSLAKKTYALDAFIPRKPEIPGTLALSSEDLKLSGNYFLDPNNLIVKNARLETRGLTVDGRGKVTDFQDPYCGLEGPVEINLDKFAESFAKEAPFFKAAGLKGSLKGFFTFNGLWNRPLDAELKVDAGSPLIWVNQSIRLLGFEMQARMKDRVLRIGFLRANSYQGNVSGEILFNLLKPEIYFDGKLRANEIDLRLLMPDLDPSKKDMAGKLMLQTSLNGILGSEESFRGNGFIDIHDGRFFKTDLFRSMGNLPFVRVEGLDLVEFTSLSADFLIHDKKAWTEDMRLSSETVDLALRGSVGFDQSLDMVMDIRYSDDVIRGAYDTGGLVPFVVQQAEKSISQYKVSGTLKEPKVDKILI